MKEEAPDYLDLRPELIASSSQERADPASDKAKLEEPELAVKAEAQEAADFKASETENDVQDEETPAARDDLMDLPGSPLQSEQAGETEAGSRGASLDDRVIDENVPEWEAMEIPQNWRPLPLFLVRNVPVSEAVGEEQVKEIVQTSAPGIEVHSITFDDRPNEVISGRRTALVRLKPLPLPWKAEGTTAAKELSLGEDEIKESESKKRKASTPPQDGDVVKMASWAVQRLKTHIPPLQIRDEILAFELSSLQVQLYIGNLSQEWQEEDAFAKAMSQYGTLERAFVMRNAAGQSKGYGFAEFSLPGSALACKQAMDEIERRMRPDPRKLRQSKQESDAQRQFGENGDSKEEQLPGPPQALTVGARPETSGRLVKLLRAEWALMRSVEALFSKVLYVTNLRTGAGSQHMLKDIFSQYGRIAEVTVPINKATNSTKGFAFVAFNNGASADRAFRALEKSGSEKIGGALVSFANSAKAQDIQSQRGAAKPGGLGRQAQGSMAMGKGHQSSRGGSGKGMQLAGAQARGMLGRGRSMLGRGAEGEDQVMRQSRLHMQAGMAANMQMARQMEMRLQAQQVHMQAQMQAQLRQAQLQVQQIQQQAQQMQRKAAEAHAKSIQEAEARKRAAEDAMKATQARYEAMQKRALAPPSSGRSSGGYGSGYEGASAPTSSAGKYGGQSGYGHAGGSSGYGAGGGYSSSLAREYGSQGGYGGNQAGFEAYGSQGLSAHDYGGYSGAEYGAAGSEYGQHGYDGYGAGGYGQQSGYGSYNESRSGGGEGSYAGYSGADYGSYGQGSGEGGYGAADGYDQSGSGSYSYQGSGSGHKRSNPYQVSQHGYGGSYGETGGEYGKRQRY